MFTYQKQIIKYHPAYSGGMYSVGQSYSNDHVSLNYLPLHKTLKKISHSKNIKPNITLNNRTEDFNKYNRRDYILM